MFLYGKVLEEKLQMTMAKYGLKTMDSDVIEMLSEAIKQKYTTIITDLIDTSRIHHSTAYLSQK
jgi:hypothetical protein